MPVPQNSEPQGESTDFKIDRRSIIAGIGASSSIGLAGCSGNDEADENLGEEVPALEVAYWSDLGAMSSLFESMLPIVKEGYEELGLDVDVRPVEYTTNVGELFSDARQSNITAMFYSTDVSHLDMAEGMNNLLISGAGDSGGYSWGSYADCEMSQIGIEQRSSETEEKRSELLRQAQQRLSEAAILQPISPFLELGVRRETAADYRSIGERGLSLGSPRYLKESVATSGTIRLEASPPWIARMNYLTMSGTEEIPWNHLVNSPLQEYDENFELENSLAESINRENEDRRIVVTLRENAEFQNGDPVTAEDVKFTFDTLWENTGAFRATAPPYESIEVVDDRVAAFNMEVPFRPISQYFAFYGVLHKKSWSEQGLAEDTDEADINFIIGSGPFEVTDFDAESFMRLEPRDNHPLYTPDHEIEVHAFRDAPTAAEAFRNQEIDVIGRADFGLVDQLEEEYGDDVSAVVSEGPLPMMLQLEYAWGPTQFRELRVALGMSIDRALIQEATLRDSTYAPTHGSFWMRNHPQAIDEDDLWHFTDDPTGDVEGARDLLENEGYSWDSDGNIHYPESKDLDPRWPEGGTPNPDDYDCLNENGEMTF